MPKISTHLWFDKQAKQAAEFYVSVFKDAEIKSATVLRDTPSGDCDLLTIRVLDHEFMMISAGPLFKFNPSVSFLVACKTKEEVQTLWEQLSVGGTALMELGEYPFSAQYGWLQDQFGLSWQIMYMGDLPITQRITPTIMFVGDVCGKAEEAMGFYTTVFHNSKVGNIMRYTEGQEPEKPGNIAHAGLTLEGQEFAIQESGHNHQFQLNEAISFVVHCATQEEIDYYWSKLSADPAAEQCGWLKDKYGLSWQVTPKAMDEMMVKGTPEQIARVTQAFLPMKKFDLAAIQKAYAGN